jgi:hypothetical protein
MLKHIFTTVRMMIATVVIVMIARMTATAAIAMMKKSVIAAMMRTSAIVMIARIVNTWKLCAHIAQRQSALTMSLTLRSLSALLVVRLLLIRNN